MARGTATRVSRRRRPGAGRVAKRRAVAGSGLTDSATRPLHLEGPDLVVRTLFGTELVELKSARSRVCPNCGRSKYSVAGCDRSCASRAVELVIAARLRWAYLVELVEREAAMA